MSNYQRILRIVFQHIFIDYSVIILSSSIQGLEEIFKLLIC